MGQVRYRISNLLNILCKDEIMDLLSSVNY